MEAFTIVDSYTIRICTFHNLQKQAQSFSLQKMNASLMFFILAIQIVFVAWLSRF